MDFLGAITLLTIALVVCACIWWMLPARWKGDVQEGWQPLETYITPDAKALLAARAMKGKPYPERVVEGCDVETCPLPAEVVVVFDEGSLLFCAGHLATFEDRIPTNFIFPYEEDAA